MGCFLDDLRAFGIKVDWSTTAAAQDEGERRRAAKQGAVQFTTKGIAVAKARAGLRHAVEKEWMGCFFDDLRSFGINADQWTTAAQEGGEWLRTAEQGAEHFMAEWTAGAKARAGLQHAVVCPNVTGKTKARIAQSRRARAGSLAIAG